MKLPLQEYKVIYQIPGIPDLMEVLVIATHYEYDLQCVSFFLKYFQEEDELSDSMMIASILNWKCITTERVIKEKTV